MLNKSHTQTQTMENKTRVYQTRRAQAAVQPVQPIQQPAQPIQQPAQPIKQPVQPKRPESVRPSSYLPAAIIAMVMCLIPFGLMSLLRSIKVNTFWDAGRYDEANEYSASAKRWAIAGIIVGGVLFIGTIILLASCEALLYDDYYYDDYYYDGEEYYYDDEEYDYYY